MENPLPHQGSIWYPLARQAVIGVFFLAWVMFSVQEKIPMQHIYFGVGVMASIFGLDLTKFFAAPSQPPTGPKE